MTTNGNFHRFQGTPGYIATGPLVDAVNCAIALGRPLLLKGEPGTGKTVLARHVAEGLGMPMLEWHIKSTSKAVEGLYVYDTVQRLNDSRFGTGDVADIRHYIKLGPLGRAFAAPERVVLLIDEVDKADLEFPNDLLHELDRMRFRILETGDEVVARHRPVVIIRSGAVAPADVFTSVQYRRTWFWIAEDDFDSKLAFTIVQILLALSRTENAPGAIVTIPAG